MTDVSDVGNFIMIQFLRDFAHEIGKHVIKEHDTATAYIFSLDFSAILMVKKRFSGRLMPPGGHVDEGEECCEAVLREVREETGIDICQLKRVLFHHTPSRVRGEFNVIPAECNEEFIVMEMITPTHIHRDHIYCFQYPKTFTRHSLNNTEIKEVQWVDINQIKKRDYYPNVYRTIQYFYCRGLHEDG